MNHQRAEALARRLFLAACLGHLQDTEYRYAKSLLSTVQYHATHARLHGFCGRIDDPAWQDADARTSTRASLRRLAHLARAARRLRLRPDPALTRDRQEMAAIAPWAFSQPQAPA